VQQDDISPTKGVVMVTWLF